MSLPSPLPSLALALLFVWHSLHSQWHWNIVLGEASVIPLSIANALREWLLWSEILPSILGSCYGTLNCRLFRPQQFCLFQQIPVSLVEGSLWKQLPSIWAQEQLLDSKNVSLPHLEISEEIGQMPTLSSVFSPQKNQKCTREKMPLRLS